MWTERLVGGVRTLGEHCEWLRTTGDFEREFAALPVRQEEAHDADDGERDAAEHVFRRRVPAKHDESDAEHGEKPIEGVVLDLYDVLDGDAYRFSVAANDVDVVRCERERVAATKCERLRGSGVDIVERVIGGHEYSMSGHCRYCCGRDEDRTPNRTLERADRTVRAHADTDSCGARRWVETLCDGEVETLCDGEVETLCDGEVETLCDGEEESA